MSLRYCPECAAQLTKKTDTQYDCPNGHAFWNNAKASVAVVFCRDEKLLVSKRNVQSDPNYGKYDLPGGFVDFGETAYEAAVREVQEELGITLRTTDLTLLEVYSNHYQPAIFTVDIIFIANNWDDNFSLNSEIAELAWKPYDFIEDPLFCEPYHGLNKLLAARDTKSKVQ